MGAWIETSEILESQWHQNVAPYMGAWIETLEQYLTSTNTGVAPYMGAWIETPEFANIGMQSVSHPTWVRGLKHRFFRLRSVAAETSHPTWVRGLKLLDIIQGLTGSLSHPTWVRGLKHSCYSSFNLWNSRTLHGCVD